MAGTLHIVKSAGSVHPWDLLAHQTAATDSCSIILIQDAVAAQPGLPCPTFVLAGDAHARKTATPYPLIEDDRLMDMIWDADTVVVW
ncbi:MAG: hypothetical protein AB1451_04850 [Nitrospirota bacterium]